MQELKKQIIKAIESKRFILEVFKLTDRRRNTKNVVTAVAELHNDDIIDAPKLFRQLGDSIEQYTKYEALDFFSKLLPFLDTAVSEASETIDYLHKLNNQDLDSGALLSPYIDFCAQDETKVLQSLDLSMEYLETKRHFVPLSLIAGSRINFKKYFEETISLSSHKTEEISSSAISTLGRLNYGKNSELIEQAQAAVSKALLTTQNPELYANALTTLVSLLNSNPKLDIKSDVHKILSLQDKVIVHTAAQIFSYYQKSIGEDLTSSILGYLDHTSPENKGTINFIDYGLRALIESGKSDKAISFIEKFLISNAKDTDINEFSSVVQELLSQDRKILNKLITKWFSSRKRTLCHAIMDIFDKLHDKEIEIQADLKLLGSDTNKRIFVARKVIGWLPLNPKAATSFLVSLIESANNDEKKELEDLLFDPLILSYPGQVGDYLQNLKQNETDSVKYVVSNVLSRFHQYSQSLKSARSLKELKAPQSQREIWLKDHNAKMAESYRAAEQHSILRQLASKTVLLYGNSSIHHVHLGNSEQKRMETPLHQFEHSMEYPRLEMLDPWGFDYQFRVLRVEGLTE